MFYNFFTNFSNKFIFEPLIFIGCKLYDGVMPSLKVKVTFKNFFIPLICQIICFILLYHFFTSYGTQIFSKFNFVAALFLYQLIAASILIILMIILLRARNHPMLLNLYRIILFLLLIFIDFKVFTFIISDSARNIFKQFNFQINQPLEFAIASLQFCLVFFFFWFFSLIVLYFIKYLFYDYILTDNSINGTFYKHIYKIEGTCPKDFNSANYINTLENIKIYNNDLFLEIKFFNINFTKILSVFQNIYFIFILYKLLIIHIKFS